MKLYKDKFLLSEFGSELTSTVCAIDFYLNEKSKLSYFENPNTYKKLENCISTLFAQWEVYKLALKCFYGIEYHFTRTDKYFGIVTRSQDEWLFKKNR